MADVKAFLAEYQANMKKALAIAPDAPKAFGGMFAALMKEGRLSVKTKELIAVGIAIETRCTECIYLHIQKCLDAGATPEEIMEAAGVAVMMRGGPAYTQLPKVAEAIEALKK
jgi:AhpD family alkylhydroperoxidase